MKFGKTLAIIAISTLVTTGAALAGGAPNDLGGAKGRDMPSSTTPAHGLRTGRSASMDRDHMRMHDRMMMKRRMMMRHRMMHHHHRM